MRAFLGYTGARLLLFVACWGVLWFVGAKSWLGVFLALVISGLLSYVLLDKLRAHLASSMTGGWRDLKQRFAAGAAAEDDEQPAEQQSAEQQSAEQSTEPAPQASKQSSGTS